MKKIIISLVAILVVMEGLGWWVYKSSKKEDSAAANTPVQVSAIPIQKTEPDKVVLKDDNSVSVPKDNTGDKKSVSDGAISGPDASSFPPPSVETVNGVVQRTIHMGVRQWAWDPSEIKVNYGEKVILIMHNADVQHSILIPELNVKASIPEEGAIVTFTASRRGTFDFFCDTPCGKGHAQMRGKITIV